MKEMNKIKRILSPGFFPFSLCFLLGIFIIAYRLFNLPTPFEISISIISLYKQYGYIIVFISAIAESLFMLSIYLPGSLAIVLAIYSIGNSPENLFFIGTVSLVGFTISNIINYYLGRLGYYKILIFFNQDEVISNMQNRLKLNYFKTIFLTSFHPNFLAITLVCLGIIKEKLLRTIIISSFSLAIWITVWTLLASKFIKKIDIRDSNQIFYVFFAFLIWGIVLVIKNYKKSLSLSK